MTETTEKKKDPAASDAPDAETGATSLAAKIAKVQREAELEGLPKRHVEVETSTGGRYTYDYIEEATLSKVIAPLLAAEGVAVYYSDEIKSLQGNLATVRVKLTLVDGETGEREEMFAEGVGTDKGDKHVNKAKTAAMRYLLWKWFLVPSDIDPERENIERSDKPPRSQVKWASDGAVESFLTLVKDAGFDVKAVEGWLDEERLEWGGVRQEWLDQQLRTLNREIEKRAAKASV